MHSIEQMVIVLDDNADIRDLVELLLISVGFKVLKFACAEALLANERVTEACCLVSDVRMPGRSGLELQDHLNRAGVNLPIVFITGFADVPLTVRAMKAGAIDVLSKPFREQELLDAVHRGILAGAARRRGEEAVSQLWSRFETLTPREREILSHVAAGRMNKQIAFEIGVSEITVKVHRGQVMRKMQARSLPELVRMADQVVPGPECCWAA